MVRISTMAVAQWVTCLMILWSRHDENAFQLHIEYSKLHSLTVKFNNDKSRDYTNPTLPPGEGPMQPQQDLGKRISSVPRRSMWVVYFLERMHGNPSFLPLPRSASNEDYHYGSVMSSFFTVGSIFHIRLLWWCCTWSTFVQLSRIQLRYAR